MIEDNKPDEKEKRVKTKKAARDAAENKNKKLSRKKEETIEKVEAEIVGVKKSKKIWNEGRENLIPLNQRTKDEQREICTKAGVASGIARRRKKELREFTRDFLMQEAASVLKGNMATLGVEAEQMSNLAAVVVRLFNKAVNQGDINAARTIIEWAGMAPLQQERENEAIARMGQVMQLASADRSSDDESDVVFYIPDNGRPVIKDEDLVTIGENE